VTDDTECPAPVDFPLIMMVHDGISESMICANKRLAGTPLNAGKLIAAVVPVKVGRRAAKAQPSCPRIFIPEMRRRGRCFGMACVDDVSLIRR
jgi:hypothetical protein